MDGAETLGDRDSVGQGLAPGERSSLEKVPEGSALQKFSDDVVNLSFRPNVVEHDDARMIEGGDSSSLTREARECLRAAAHRTRKNLDRDLPAKPGIDGGVHFSHASGAQVASDLIGT
jgi:hypothetical protein